MKKHRDRRVRSEIAREAKRAHLDSTSRRRNNELLALAERRVALEHAREEDDTLNRSSTSNTVHQDIILSTTPDLPHVFSLMDELPNGGLIESTFDDELIQMGMDIDPIFSSMPVDLLSTAILEVGLQRDDFEATRGAQPLLPGRAFQLNNIEKQGIRELRQMDRIVEAAQERLLQEFETQQASETALLDLQSNEGESEIDYSKGIPIDDHYPSGSDAGDDLDDLDNLDNLDNLNEGDYNEDNVVMEERLIQDGWVVEGGQYPEDHALPPWASSSRSAQKRGVIQLHQQTDSDVEITVRPGSPLPSGLVNVARENMENPFKTVAPSHSNNEDMESISGITCFTVVILHVMAGLSRSWCEFILQVFVYIFNALGQSNLARQIPNRLPTAMPAHLPTTYSPTQFVRPVVTSSLPVWAQA